MKTKKGAKCPVGSFDTLWPQTTLRIPAPRVHCVHSWRKPHRGQFLRKYFAVSFLGHRRCKWFQGYFKWTPFANYIQVMQNLNQLYNWDINTKFVILLNFDSIWITKGALTCPFSHPYQGCIDMIRSGIVLSNTLLNPSGEGIGKYCPMQCVGKYCPREYIGNGCPRK